MSTEQYYTGKVLLKFKDGTVLKFEHQFDYEEPGIYKFDNVFAPDTYADTTMETIVSIVTDSFIDELKQNVLQRVKKYGGGVTYYKFAKNAKLRRVDEIEYLLTGLYSNNYPYSAIEEDEYTAFNEMVDYAIKWVKYDFINRKVDFAGEKADEEWKMNDAYGHKYTEWINKRVEEIFAVN